MPSLTKTDIANLAIKHLGHSTPMQNLDDDNTAVAHTCRFFYPRALRAVLRDFEWPFANTIFTMQTTTDDPGEHWDYAYQYPPDCARFLKIQSDFRTDSRYSKIPYKRSKGAAGSIILTDREDAVCEYTALVTNVAYFDDDFILALSWRLAVYAAPSVTGGDPFKLKKDAMEMYRQELALARENALNEQCDDEDALSEYELSRL